MLHERSGLLHLANVYVSLSLSLSLSTKLRLYNVYILPVLRYGDDAWSTTVTARQRLDAFDQWCLRHTLHIPYTTHVPKLAVCM